MVRGLARVSALICALAVCVSFSSGSVRAIPRAAELGPQVPLTKPRDGYVGHLALAPTHGAVGTPIMVTGEGFPPE